MENVKDLVEKLKDNHRPEKPKYANNQIYEIMMQCWNSCPDERPKFEDISQRLGEFLDITVKNVC